MRNKQWTLANTENNFKGLTRLTDIQKWIDFTLTLLGLKRVNLAETHLKGLVRLSDRTGSRPDRIDLRTYKLGSEIRIQKY